jgi:hypothetical protein
MPADDRAYFEVFHATFAPLAAELDAATRELLLPALDGLQSLVLVDGAGVLPRPPGTPLAGLPELRVPRPALVFEVRDAAKVRAAFSRYRLALNAFIAGLVEAMGGPPPFLLPEPDKRAAPGGDLYSYRSLLDLGPDCEPHAVLTENLLIAGLFPAQSQAIVAAAAAPPASAVLRFAEPAGSAAVLDLRALAALVCDDLNVLAEHFGRQGTVPPPAAVLVQVHLPVVRRALSALRSFGTRTYEEDGFSVTHSWFHIEDD